MTKKITTHIHIFYFEYNSILLFLAPAHHLQKYKTELCTPIYAHSSQYTHTHRHKISTRLLGRNFFLFVSKEKNIYPCWLGRDQINTYFFSRCGHSRITNVCDVHNNNKKDKKASSNFFCPSSVVTILYLKVAVKKKSCFQSRSLALARLRKYCCKLHSQSGAPPHFLFQLINATKRRKAFLWTKVTWCTHHKKKKYDDDDDDDEDETKSGLWSSLEFFFSVVAVLIFFRDGLLY